MGDKFTPFFWRYLRWRPPHILWNCLNSWNLFLIFIAPLTYLEVIFVSSVLEACCYGACLQPTPRYCNESGEACRFPCHGNTRACKVLKDSGWEMNPPPSPKDLCHTGFACWLESQRPLSTCADVTLYSGQFTLSTQLLTLKYPVMLSHWHSTKVFVEIYPLYSSAPLRDCRQAHRHKPKS